jgi:hypothetical protein
VFRVLYLIGSCEVKVMEAFISETYTGGVFISKFRHTNSVKAIAEQISQEDFELLLGMAANALNSMKDSVKSIEYKEALEKEIEKHRVVSEGEKTVLKDVAGVALKEIEARAAKEAEGLRRQIEELRGALLASEAGQAKVKEQFAEIGAKAEAAFKNSLAELVSQRDSQYQKELARLQENHSQTIERMREDTRESIGRSDAQSRETLASMKATYAELEAKLRAAHEKSFVSVEKGKQGEKEFEELCAQHTSWGPLVNTSKEEAATDRRCVIRDCSTMFEVKKYKNTIPTAELNKFRRDMKEHTESPLGVFISLHTEMSNKRGKYIDTEWTDNSQLLVYISAFYTHSIPDTLDFIDSCATIAMAVYRAAKKSQDSDGVGLLSRIELAKLSVSKELERVTECIDSLTRNKKDVVTLIERQFVDTRLQMSLMKTGLAEMLQVLLGKHEESVSASVSEASNPASVDTEKKKRGKKAS